MEGKSLLSCDVRYHDLHMCCAVSLYIFASGAASFKSTSVT